MKINQSINHLKVDKCRRFLPTLIRQAELEAMRRHFVFDSSIEIWDKLPILAAAHISRIEGHLTLAADLIILMTLW